MDDIKRGLLCLLFGGTVHDVQVRYASFSSICVMMRVIDIQFAPTIIDKDSNNQDNNNNNNNDNSNDSGNIIKYYT